MALYRRTGAIGVVLLITGCSIALSILATLALVVPQLSPEEQAGETLLVSLGIAVAVPSLVAPISVWLILSLLVRLDEAYLSVLRLSTTDSLTGATNRRGFFAEASARLRNWHPAEYGLVGMLDLDRFKTLNDRFGHNVGDEVLSAVAARLQAILANGIVGRLGGDEFAFLITGPRDTIEQVLQAVRVHCGCFALEHDASAQPIAVSVSIGVIELQREESVDQALARADQALYEEKSKVGSTTTAASEPVSPRLRARQATTIPADSLLAPETKAAAAADLPLDAPAQRQQEQAGISPVSQQRSADSSAPALR